MRRWAHRFAIGCSAVLLAGCAGAPVGPQDVRVPPEATVGSAVELYGEHPLAISVAVGAPGVAHVAAITTSGTLLHFVVDQDGKVDRRDLARVDPNEARDLAIGADGAIHLLLGARYVRFSDRGREEADGTYCERLALTPTQVLCTAELYPESTPGSVGPGRSYAFGPSGPLRGRKAVIGRFDAGAWSAIAVLEPDSDWDTQSATLYAAPDGVVQVLYRVAGPVNALLQSSMTRVAAFRVPQSDGLPPAALTGVDVWEFVPGSEPSVLPPNRAASALPPDPGAGDFGFVEPFWRRYGTAQAAADGPLVALVRPAGLAYTRFPSDQAQPLIAQDASDVLLVKDGRLLREMPVRAEDSGWTSFVLTRVVAPAGASRFHLVTVSKDDLFGFVMKARYLEIVTERWSTPVELGRVADRPDLVKIAAGEDGRAFVVLPLAAEHLVGRWITLHP